jgi:hypothetical protein
VREDEDDDALSWGGESDPTHVDAPAEVRATAETAPAAGSSTSSVMLVVYGVFAGAYLLYLVGWILAVQRDTITLPTLFGEIMYQFGEFLAIASPVVWFGAVLLLTSSAKPLARLTWLVVGLLLVAPWPFILGGLA